ncbi:unnamed protein product [Brassica rapa]|uniref:non-specific serine/threonine protein kinase n=2 Tax=Brassica TaxID=3705 RepID=A0A816Z649_BRANA|nr:unnamed protein product [Brassica napus]CAG7903308.1 unnamed protein product [Brassica rapa]VDD00198.1 unnamed protein product [Brassica rapa]
MERYDIVKDIGSGNFGVAKLVRDKVSKELFAIKFIERGHKIDEHVQREIMNHRSLNHPNIIRFKEVLLTATHLAIVMEYAAGGELFERICSAGRFGEDEARFFFQQLISGVSYCHSLQICHRDLKLENTLLDGSTAPRVKICDFGYSKSGVLHSQPKTTVGTPAYIAPEVLSKREYDGKIADVWSCGVTLYVMLVGAYPFEDPSDPKDFRKTIGRILRSQYSIPDYVRVSDLCKHLLSRIFVANPEKRITMEEIKNHSWFLKNLPVDMSEGSSRSNNPSQSEEEIVWIIEEARKAITGASGLSGAGGSGDSGSGAMGSSMDLDDLDVDYDDDIDTALFFSQLVAASENKSSSGPAFLSVPEAPSFFLILFSFALFTLAQSFVEMLGVLWLTKRYLFSFRWRRSRLSMEQRRDSRRDDSEEGRRLGLKGFVRSGFSLSDLWKFFLGDRSNHVAELNNPLPTTMRWIRLVVRARHHWKRG